MNKQTITVGLVALVLGLGAGIIGTSSWMGTTEPGHNDRDEHADDDDHGEQAGDDEDGGHGDHDDHAGEDGPGDEPVVRLSNDERERFGIKVAIAAPGNLTTQISLPGEIVLNADRVAHIVPRVEGIVRSVSKSLGDPVEQGEVMAVLESRELAEAKSEDIAAEERLALAQANFTRAEQLRTKGISSEEDYLTAKQQLAEAGIEHRKTEAGLYALGLTADQVQNVSAESDATFSVYELKAPFSGTIVDKHISIGELVDSKSEVFTLADLSSVWVDISVYQKDLAHVRKGMGVTISAGAGMPHAQGTITYMAPVVDQKTRTALARVVLPNPDGRLRPGLFVSAEIALGQESAAVVIPKSAVQRMDEEPVVFLDEAEGFTPALVSLGRSNQSHVEILSGLAAGQRYVTQGAFELKAKIVTSGLDAHAGHGH